MNGDAEKRLRSVSRLPNVIPRNPGTLPIAPSDMLEPCTSPLGGPQSRQIRADLEGMGLQEHQTGSILMCIVRP